MTPVIKFLIGIIPVSHLKKRLHGDACHQLKRRGPDTSRNIGQKNIVLKGHGYHQHHDGAAAVDRKIGPSHESPVYKMPAFDRHERGLENPPEKAVKIKEKQPLYSSIVQHLPILLFT